MTDNKPYVDLLPIFDDNYIFVIIHPASKECLFVDPGTLDELPTYVREHGLTPRGVLITHHHHDHIGGVRDVLKHWFIPVFAPAQNKMQIPEATNWVKDQDVVSVGPFTFGVMALPGHTLGHVAYFNVENNWLFSGDVLFGLGCGRLFEGTFEQAFQSLQKIKALSPSTSIFCTHEYTEANLNFCKSLPPFSEALQVYEQDLLKKRSKDQPSVPLNLKKELQANPFLLAKDVLEFQNLRELRNKF